MTQAKVVEVEIPGGGVYPIHIEPAALDDVASFCTRYAPAHRYAVISDSQVTRLYGEAVLGRLRDSGLGAELVSFPAGERNKTREQWASLGDRLLRAGFGRDSAFIALGGGVTGDLAGFVAATYMRGVPVVQVPTSLLAMLDSSVGGKTGLNTEAGKNLIGAFHHPAAVLIDPAVLETLPRPERSAGLAEAVKTAAILDEGLCGWIEDNAAALADGESEPSAQLIERVVRHKAGVVSEDPSERGRREMLNFGHTVGHALEALGGYDRLHGEAVAAGMRVEARWGEALGLTAAGSARRLAATLEACELGGSWEADRRSSEIRAAMLGDKKTRRGRLRCVFLARIGRVAVDPHGSHAFELTDHDLGGPLSAALRPA